MHLIRSWPLPPGRTRWLGAAAAFLLLGALALVDAPLSQFGQALPEPVITVAGWITRLGESDWILIPALVLFALSAGLALVIPKELPRAALREMAGLWAFVFIGVGLPSLFTTIVKRVIGRSRPIHYDSVGTLDFRTLSWADWTYQSFPSGHTTTAFALCFVVAFLSPRWYPAMLVLAVLIALSRIVVGAHYPTDLLAGAVVGTLGAYFVRNVFAARGFVFERVADGSIVPRPLSAVEKLVRRQ